MTGKHNSPRGGIIRMAGVNKHMVVRIAVKMYCMNDALILFGRSSPLWKMFFFELKGTGY